MIVRLEVRVMFNENEVQHTRDDYLHDLPPVQKNNRWRSILFNDTVLYVRSSWMTRVYFLVNVCFQMSEIKRKFHKKRKWFDYVDIEHSAWFFKWERLCVCKLIRVMHNCNSRSWIFACSSQTVEQRLPSVWWFVTWSSKLFLSFASFDRSLIKSSI